MKFPMFRKYGVPSLPTSVPPVMISPMGVGAPPVDGTRHIAVSVHCVCCDYDLRGIKLAEESTNCPECGFLLRPSLDAWITPNVSSTLARITAWTLISSVLVVVSIIQHAIWFGLWINCGIIGFARTIPALPRFDVLAPIVIAMLALQLRNGLQSHHQVLLTHRIISLRCIAITHIALCIVLSVFQFLATTIFTAEHVNAEGDPTRDRAFWIASLIGGISTITSMILVSRCVLSFLGIIGRRRWSLVLASYIIVFIALNILGFGIVELQGFYSRPLIGTLYPSQLKEMVYFGLIGLWVFLLIISFACSWQLLTASPAPIPWVSREALKRTCWRILPSRRGLLLILSLILVLTAIQCFWIASRYYRWDEPRTSVMYNSDGSISEVKVPIGRWILLRWPQAWAAIRLNPNYQPTTLSYEYYYWDAVRALPIHGGRQAKASDFSILITVDNKFIVEFKPPRTFHLLDREVEIAITSDVDPELFRKRFNDPSLTWYRASDGKIGSK
jgi:hypothetical protein